MYKSGKYEQSVVSLVESVYDNFTHTEKKIADFFISNEMIDDMSSKSLSNHLHVSESSISRFSQKCGYNGYREFLYHYKSTINRQAVDRKNSKLTHLVIDTYQDLLAKSFSMVDVEKIKRICNYINNATFIYSYGLGNSSSCADEFKFRFTRFGCKVISEASHHTMRVQATSMNDECLVIGISVSGKTEEILNTLKTAKKSGATTILITSNNNKHFQKYCDEVFLVAVKKNLEEGKFISPQFPVLVMIDLLFAYYLNYYQKNTGLYDKTISEFKG